MDRRELLQWRVVTGGMATVSTFSARDLESLGAVAHERLAADNARSPRLTARELLIVAAVAECIIPRTDTPGATDARVAEFVDVMMADWYPSEAADRFRTGVAALDATSRSRFAASYPEASHAQQAELAQSLDDEVTALRRARDPRAGEHWFAMLKYLTVWGYCTSEVAMRELFHNIERPMRYDGAAPVGGDA